MDSPQDSLNLDMKSVQISEAPNSKDHLDALFEVLVSRQDQPKTQPMIDRKLPRSFYDASAPDKLAGIRLGPSINVGPPPGPNEHLRSFSMPARMDHSRQFSEGSLGPIPSGWEAAKTPDGISYFIEWVFLSIVVFCFIVMFVLAIVVSITPCGVYTLRSSLPISS